MTLQNRIANPDEAEAFQVAAAAYRAEIERLAVQIHGADKLTDPEIKQVILMQLAVSGLIVDSDLGVLNCRFRGTGIALGTQAACQGEPHTTSLLLGASQGLNYGLENVPQVMQPPQGSA